MDTKRTITIILIMMVVLLFWQRMVSTWYQANGWQQPAHKIQEASTAATAPSTTSPTTNGTANSATQISTAPVRAVPATQEARAELGSAAASNSDFRMAVSLDSVGAGIDSVVLNEFKKSVNSLAPYEYQTPYEGFESDSRPLATRSVEMNGATIDLVSSVWKLQSSSATGATFSLDLADQSGAPLARLTKTFQLFHNTDQANGSGYEVQITQSIANVSAKPIDAGLSFNGPTTPPRELDRGSDRMMIGGYLNGEGAYVMQHYIESFTAKAPTQDFSHADKNDYPLLWAGAASVYFNALVMPLEANSPTPKFIRKVSATVLNPDVEDSKQHEVLMTFETTPVKIAPGAVRSFNARVFFGPKKRSLLTTGIYAQLPRDFNATLVITSGFCGYCTFAWLIDVLVSMLAAFHWLLHDWGLSIILLVFIVRFLLHPITKKSQINMANMSKFGPEMEKLKAKYKDQPDELNKAMMGFYKEHGATPILGCLPMFLQMPIWIALWQALQTTFELRLAPFLRFGRLHLTWIKDLSQPDHLITLSHPFTLWILPISGLNILPILMGIVFFVQQKYFAPKPPSMSPEQESQQKMMQWMTGALFPLMLYAGPSGLNLYILTSTTFGIIESKVIRDHIKQKEEAEKAGKVIVDPGKKFGGKRDNPQPSDKDKPKGKFASWLANMQAKAEQIQRDAKRGGPKS